MSSEERGGGAAHRALEHFEGELMFEGEWVPPTPFNGIAFLAAGAVLRHLHRRTQARGEPRARALNEKRHARLARPDRASVPDDLLDLAGRLEILREGHPMADDC